MDELLAIFSGRVQGVGFRSILCRYAEKYRLKGHAKNLSDGTVEVVAVGTRGALEMFLQEVRAHKGAVLIEDVDCKFQKAINEHPSFRIID